MSQAVVGEVTQTLRQWKRYPAYKDSGIEWLGEIPAHWEVKRLKFVAAEPLKYGVNESAELNDPNLPRFIRITDIAEDGSLREDTFRSLSEDIAEPYLLETGDLLFARSGATVGKSSMYRESWGRACYAGYLIRVRIKSSEAIPKFISYFATSSEYWNWLSSVFIQATIQNVSAEKYANLFVTVPPLEEQCLIASFLDRETAKIDALIAKKEQLIQLLQEKRTALISHAVTKGLDPSAPMKDSGVEWLGEIPTHWEVKRIKYLALILRGKFTHRPRNDPRLYDGSYPFIQTGDIAAASRYITNYQQTLNELGFAVSKEFPRGTLVMAIAANIGDLAILQFPACFPDSIVGFVPKVDVYLDYLYYNLTAMKQEMIGTATLNTQLNLNIERIGSLFSVCPPSDEQCAIASFLDRELAKIDALIAKICTGIEQMKEYRTSLISAVVTGKIDVCKEPSAA